MFQISPEQVYLVYFSPSALENEKIYFAEKVQICAILKENSTLRLNFEPWVGLSADTKLIWQPFFGQTADQSSQQQYCGDKLKGRFSTVEIKFIHHIIWSTNAPSEACIWQKNRFLFK